MMKILSTPYSSFNDTCKNILDLFTSKGCSVISADPEVLGFRYPFFENFLDFVSNFGKYEQILALFLEPLFKISGFAPWVKRVCIGCYCVHKKPVSS